MIPQWVHLYPEWPDVLGTFQFKLRPCGLRLGHVWTLSFQPCGLIFLVSSRTSTDSDPQVEGRPTSSWSPRRSWSWSANMDVVQNEWQDKEWECYKNPVNSNIPIMFWSPWSCSRWFLPFSFSFSVLFGWCCALCMVCDTAQRMGESVPMYCCFVSHFIFGPWKKSVKSNRFTFQAYCCFPCAMFKIRSTTREKFGIEVNKVGIFPFHEFLMGFLHIFFRVTPPKMPFSLVVVHPASIAKSTRSTGPGRPTKPACSQSKMEAKPNRIRISFNQIPYSVFQFYFNKLVPHFTKKWQERVPQN